MKINIFEPQRTQRYTERFKTGNYSLCFSSVLSVSSVVNMFYLFCMTDFFVRR